MSMEKKESSSWNAWDVFDELLAEGKQKQLDNYRQLVDMQRENVGKKVKDALDRARTSRILFASFSLSVQDDLGGYDLVKEVRDELTANHWEQVDMGEAINKKSPYFRATISSSHFLLN